MHQTQLVSSVCETGTDYDALGHRQTLLLLAGIVSRQQNIGGQSDQCQNKIHSQSSGGNLTTGGPERIPFQKCLGGLLLGAPKAITATAHKLARIIYAILSQGGTYEDLGETAYEAKYQDCVKDNLMRKARKLGYDLIPIGVGEASHKIV